MNVDKEDVIDTLQSDWRREIPSLNTRPMGVVGRILHLSSLLETEANSALRSFDLQYTEFDVLATLRRTGKPYQLSPKQLRRAILITSGAMTACLDRLENPGLIKRKPDPTDRRGTIIQLTQSGKTLVERAAKARFEVAERQLSSLSKTDAKALSDLLRKLTLSTDLRK